MQFLSNRDKKIYNVLSLYTNIYTSLYTKNNVGNGTIQNLMYKVM